jgi:hypothetical protein
MVINKKKEREIMYNFNRLSFVSIIFLGLFLFLSLPSAQSAEATANAPIMVASQEATIPLAANAVTGAAEAECPYTLTFKLAAVALHRDVNKSDTVVPLIGAGDLNLGWAPGMDTSLMLQNECYGIEVRYLGLAQWSESKSASVSFSEPGEVPIFGEIDSSAKFKSALHNAELNLHWWPCANDRYSLLMGFRWFQLRDRLSLSFFEEVTDRVTNFIDVHEGISSRNNLYGGQVGVEGLLFGKRESGFSIDGSVKAGVFQNNIRNKVSGEAESSESGFDSISASWNRTKTAFLGEVNLNANYAFTKNIAMTVGYLFLYVNKVAVAVNDLSTQSVIFQGGRLGLNVAF